MTLAATATGYTRSAGSFLTDRLSPGMEIAPAGFASNPVDVIRSVTALEIITKNGRAVEAAAAGRSLAVGLPSDRAWENISLSPTAGKPYAEEQYIPGPSAQVTLGPLGELELTPMYALYVHVPAGNGIGAPSRYADAILRHFTPRTAIAVGTDTLRVRTDVGPFRGQLQAGDAGYSVVPVTIPFFMHTPNHI
ncbi:MAG TPA: phage tail terminator-like protein [Bradyrhizobium sp.]|nr:phage tail terminator-like protein [Bradyrhizobium sp.]